MLWLIWFNLVREHDVTTQTNRIRKSLRGNTLLQKKDDLYYNLAFLFYKTSILFLVIFIKSIFIASLLYATAYKRKNKEKRREKKKLSELDFSAEVLLSLKDTAYYSRTRFYSALKVRMSHIKSSWETHEACNHNRCILGWCFVSKAKHVRWVGSEQRDG